MNVKSQKDGLDLAGFGKLAKAIPKEVYVRSTKTLLTTFENLVAPITESTSGLGRYIRQKFDNMVEVEKAIATYTLERAIERSKLKLTASRALLRITHPKSFVRVLEEASKETDPLLNEMWTNLLAAEIADDISHPHFIETLTHFSPAEAKLLVALCSKFEVGEHAGQFFFSSLESFTHWTRRTDDHEKKPWTYSCTLLREFHFADVLVPKEDELGKEGFAILYRTSLGDTFLKLVSA